MLLILFRDNWFILCLLESSLATFISLSFLSVKELISIYVVLQLFVWENSIIFLFLFWDKLSQNWGKSWLDIEYFKHKLSTNISALCFKKIYKKHKKAKFIDKEIIIKCISFLLSKYQKSSLDKSQSIDLPLIFSRQPAISALRCFNINN